MTIQTILTLGIIGVKQLSMKRITIFGILLHYLFIGACCHHGYRTLLLQNNYNDTIYVTTVFSFETNYPDTALPVQKPSISYVPPGKKWVFTNIFPSFREAEVFFDRLPSDTLSVYLFDASTYLNDDWQQVRSAYKVLKRYDLSLDDFIKLNWTIRYPPTEAMKDMKQFPPY